MLNEKNTVLVKLELWESDSIIMFGLPLTYAAKCGRYCNLLRWVGLSLSHDVDCEIEIFSRMTLVR
jgi:hypothetical protein